MTITYDNSTDAKYIQIGSGNATRTVKEKPWLLVDYDAAESIVGIEVLDASKHPLTVLTLAGKVVSYSSVDLGLGSTPTPKRMPDGVIFDFSSAHA